MTFNNLFNTLKNPWVLLSYLLLVILCFTLVDKHLALYFHQLNLGTTRKILSLFTNLGAWFIYVGIFLAAGTYFRFIKKHAINEATSWFLLGCVLIPNLFNFVLKITLSRARPELLFTENLYGFYWLQWKDAYWSFPSGHAVTVASLAAGLSTIVPKYFYAFMGAALLVALTRVVLYRHYLSDIMVGFYLALLVVGFFAHYMKRK